MRGRHERAQQHIHKLADVDSQRAAEVASEVAMDYVGKGDYHSAIRYYRIALEIDPDNPLTYDRLGSAHRMAGDWEAALASYRKALLLRPDFPEAYNNLGVVLQDQGNWKGALEAYQRAISLDPKLTKTRSNLASVYKQMNRYDEALDQYAVIRRLEPDNAEVCVVMGDLRLRLAKDEGEAAEGEFYRAEYDYQEALQRRGDFAPAYNGLGQVYFELQDYKKALTMFYRSLDLDPDQESVREWIQKCSQQLGMVG
jgi:tetratricopeptide (TPR) repeat protein